MKGAAYASAPKCTRCQGFGFEPETVPMALCTACGGSGRPPAPAPAQTTGELLDG